MERDKNTFEYVGFNGGIPAAECDRALPVVFDRDENRYHLRLPRESDVAPSYHDRAEIEQFAREGLLYLLPQPIFFSGDDGMFLYAHRRLLDAAEVGPDQRRREWLFLAGDEHFVLWDHENAVEAKMNALAKAIIQNAERLLRRDSVAFALRAAEYSALALRAARESDLRRYIYTLRAGVLRALGKQDVLRRQYRLFISRHYPDWTLEQIEQEGDKLFAFLTGPTPKMEVATHRGKRKNKLSHVFANSHASTPYLGPANREAGAKFVVLAGRCYIEVNINEARYAHTLSEDELNQHIKEIVASSQAATGAHGFFEPVVFGALQEAVSSPFVVGSAIAGGELGVISFVTEKVSTYLTGKLANRAYTLRVLPFGSIATMQSSSKRNY